MRYPVTGDPDHDGGATRLLWGLVDLLAGVALPILCLVEDPLVYQPFWEGERLLPREQVFGHVLIAVQIAGLLIWIVLRRRAQGVAALFGGFFVVGAIYALRVGVLLLPYSVVGLLFVVGLCGFIPFLTAAALLRNVVEAFRDSMEYLYPRSVSVLAVLGFAVALVPPIAIDHLAHRSIDAVLADPSSGRAVQRAAWISAAFSEETDRIVYEFRACSVEGRRALLAEAYRVIIGHRLEPRLDELDRLHDRGPG